MASSSSSRSLMPPPPLPPGRGMSTNPSTPDPDIASDSDSDTVTGTPSHASSPSWSQTLDTKNNLESKYLATITAPFLLEDLKAAVSGYHATASYCLGGKVLISTPRETEGRTNAMDESEEEDNESNNSSQAPMKSPAITIRFDSPPTSRDTPDQKIHKVTFPIRTPSQTRFSSKVSTPVPSSTLTSLLRACTPATFGHAGRDVLDERHRKAGKLDAENFSTNFHPADYGILDAVKQTLLPGLNGTGLGTAIGVGSGREEHWGVRAELYKLNVYSGPSGMFQKHVDTPRGATQFGSLVVCGQLLVSHEGHVSIFDWSTSNSTPEDKDAIKWCAFYSDCEHEVLPVTAGHRVTITYNLSIIVSAIRGREEDVGGAWIYEQRETNQLMPYALKGIDAVLFAVFSSLGVNVRVRPVLDNEAWEREDEYYQTEYKEHWNYVEGEGFESWKARQVAITRYGSGFEGIGSSDHDGLELSKAIKNDWPLVESYSVEWLNEATAAGWEPAIAHLRYGNDYCLSWSYSHAAIFIEIPPREERKPVPENGLGFPDWETRAAEESKWGTVS
ncbi:hypothetical protein BKA64DRAFT_635633 [Cadophora sp. MPI-SDFR-AT-0126]|nr:hypothetical protein BKA64DRAFT_635633 [Leotiomycetes sp. MPI-SDFR-AT-0126]